MPAVITRLLGLEKQDKKLREKKTGNEFALVDIIYDKFVRTT